MIAPGSGHQYRGRSPFDVTPPPPLGPNVPPGRRIAWIRDQLRLYANDLALDVLVGDMDPDWAWIEAAGACTEFGVQTGASGQETAAAFRAEWAAAQARATETLEHLRRRIWPLAAARQPEAAIQAAADEVLRSHHAYLTDEALNPLLRGIYGAATRPKRRRAA